jgi:hypothetical protein
MNTPFPILGSRVNLDSRHCAANLGEQTSGQTKSLPPQPIGGTMERYRVQSR